MFGSFPPATLGSIGKTLSRPPTRHEAQRPLTLEGSAAKPTIRRSGRKRSRRYGIAHLRPCGIQAALPIEAQGDELKAGVAAIEAGSGRRLGILEFITGVEEIFDVQVLPDIRRGEILAPTFTAFGTLGLSASDGLDQRMSVSVVASPRNQDLMEISMNQLASGGLFHLCPGYRSVSPHSAASRTSWASVRMPVLAFMR